MKASTGARVVATLVSIVVLGMASRPAAAQMPPGGLNPQQIDELSHKHDGYFGALAPENLAKPRPAPPFNLTGTWFVDLRKSFADFLFGPPYPEFYQAGQMAMKEAAAAMKEGKTYRDSIGQCYPAGMPMIMTRVWPISMIQVPTAIYMLFGFTNSMRFVYLDGRSHTDPDTAIFTYNGESIGRWEGKELVIHTKYFETNEHYIDFGLPISDQFEMIERVRLKDQGKTLEIEYTMTDPKNWKGEWKSTKRWMRADYSDIPEVECLPNLNRNLPSTEEGQAAMKEREAAAAEAGKK
jgi:hypothetical protein